jgi:uncharacterized protein (TIRG00374 family)
MTLPPKYKKTLQFVLLFTLTVLLLWLSFRGINWTELRNSVATANYTWVIAGVLIGIVAYFVRAWRWRLLIEPLGGKPSVRKIYRAVIIGYLANFVFPRLGEVARCGALAKSSGIPFDKLVGTVVTERLFDLICLILLIITGIVIYADTFGQFLQNAAGDMLANIHLSAVFAVATSGLAAVVAGLFFLFKYKKNNHLVQKILRFLHGIVEGLTSFVRMQRRWEFLVSTLMLWGLYWVMSWVVLYAVPSWSHLTIADGLLVMLLGSLGIVAPTNGGLGSFHAILRYGMPVLFGVSEADALSYAVLSHESQAIFIVILGLIAYILVFVKKNKE